MQSVIVSILIVFATDRSLSIPDADIRSDKRKKVENSLTLRRFVALSNEKSPPDHPTQPLKDLQVLKGLFNERFILFSIV